MTPSLPLPAAATDNARVYLGGLSDKVTADDLHKYLSIYGRINEIKLRPGFGFVQFESDKDARDVVHTFSTRQFLGQDVTVQMARPDRHSRAGSGPIATPIRGTEVDVPPPDSSKKMKFSVCVKGLSPRTCWQELKDFGRALGGDVAYCDIDRDTRTQGFLNYTREEDADRAVRELDGQELLGHVVRLKRVYPTGTGRWERPRSGRSRSPSRRTHGKSAEQSKARHAQSHSQQLKPSRVVGGWRDRPYFSPRSSYEPEEGLHNPYSGYHHDVYHSGRRHPSKASAGADYQGAYDHYYEPYQDQDLLVEHPTPLLLPRRTSDSHVPIHLPRSDVVTTPMFIPRPDPPPPTTPPITHRLEPSTPPPVAEREPAIPTPCLEADFGTDPAHTSEPDLGTPASIVLCPLPPLPPIPTLSSLAFRPH